jgi:hypothetical protein
MSPTIPGMRRSVAPSGAPSERPPSGAPAESPRSCCQIDLQPSARAAWLLGGWLIVACAAIVGAVDLPLPARIGVCVVIATAGWAAIGECVLLRGLSAVRGLRWSGGWVAGIGPDRIQTPVTLRSGSIRVGRAFLLLWLRSRDGIHGVIIDMGRQDPRAIRRLCRQLLPSIPKV